ncbi:hypothetical protein [Nostoc sp. CCY 9925]|uniref:hypothetical protein n=1 Tax=Nostoc sp. CCY 9925 TaxID=3103865 RepID=UPI0039C6C5E6
MNKQTAKISMSLFAIADKRLAVALHQSIPLHDEDASSLLLLLLYTENKSICIKFLTLSQAKLLVIFPNCHLLYYVPLVSSSLSLFNFLVLT